jgi:hypothetical protein
MLILFVHDLDELFELKSVRPRYNLRFPKGGMRARVVSCGSPARGLS